MTLRNGRGRIRCADCQEWAVLWERRATEWSVSTFVPVCYADSLRAVVDRLAQIRVGL